MLDSYQQLVAGPLYQESLENLQADIQHANALAASIPRGKGGACFQMKLVYNHLAPILLFFLQWIDCSCTCLLSSYLNLFHIVVFKMGGQISPHAEGKLPLETSIRLHGDLDESETTQKEVNGLEMVVRKKLEDKKLSDVDMEREDECGICLEPCTKMVLPNCCHAMNTRSESCPFCRGTLKKVNSGDLWVLTCSNDVVDTQTVLRDDILRFYLFINSLPKDIPDALFFMYYEYLF
ncbi:e3 ubiquitin-protein ligase airp2 [Quercus suber]|uniref:E3 ubiquitin-protein ligase airp2 n=1 Tax=Quercus suber TaxID=58331 RepID=A0AAW0IMM2_QUESU